MKLELSREDLKRIISKWAVANLACSETVESVEIAGYGSTVTVHFVEPKDDIAETVDAQS